MTIIWNEKEKRVAHSKIQLWSLSQKSIGNNFLSAYVQHMISFAHSESVARFEYIAVVDSAYFAY